MLICSYERQKVSDILRFESSQKVILLFIHGLGDVLLFIKPLEKLRSLFPQIQIDVGLQNGVGQEYLIPNAKLISDCNIEQDGYDYTFQVHFPMSEHLNGRWTKSEWCCIQELGIEPIPDLPELGYNGENSNIVGCSFQATALPDSCNVPYDTAKKIWNEIKDVGYVPRETLFKHRYFNPVNEKYDFIDNHCRDKEANIESLQNELSGNFANLCVATGSLPYSMSINSDRTCYLKKSFSINCYTKKNVKEIDIVDYKNGSISEWLNTL